MVTTKTSNTQTPKNEIIFTTVLKRDFEKLVPEGSFVGIGLTITTGWLCVAVLQTGGIATSAFVMAGILTVTTLVAEAHKMCASSTSKSIVVRRMCVVLTTVCLLWLIAWGLNQHKMVK